MLGWNGLWRTLNILFNSALFENSLIWLLSIDIYLKYNSKGIVNFMINKYIHVYFVNILIKESKITKNCINDI